MKQTTARGIILIFLLTSWTGLSTVTQGSEHTLFDFTKPLPQNNWRVVNDDVMGGVSTSRFEVQPEMGAVFSGTVSLENNGGFASVRSASKLDDLTDYDGLQIRVRGDGNQYKISLRRQGPNRRGNYQAVFKTKKGEWQTHHVSWEQFKPTFRGRVLTDLPPLNGSQLNGLGFLISDKQEGPFRLEISGIKAFAKP